MFALIIAIIACVTINGWISMWTKESSETTAVRIVGSTGVLVALFAFVHMA